MKGAFVAATAALLGSASAAHLHNRHAHAQAHELFEKRGEELCKTYYTTITGFTWVPTPEAFANKTAVPTKPANTTTYVKPTTAAPVTTAPVTLTTTAEVVTVPTPVVETCPTPGTYTFPATTLTVTSTAIVCGASTTSVPSGTHTLGGVTTVVETATTVVCPYATTSTAPGGVVTSIIETTTYVCPSAGTYTIAPITTVVETETVVTCPVVSTVVPGTYTKTAVTTTVTETNIVITCPWEGVATTSTVVPTTAAPAATTTPVTTVTPSSSSSSSSSAVATSTSTPGKLGGGNQWAMTYTPYTEAGACKSKSDVISDLQEIKNKGFTTIRVYSTDCDTLPNVGAGCEAAGLKMIIGVFIGEVGCNNGNPDVQSQISDIKSWGRWDLVELVVVGNEAGNQGFCTASELKELIVEVQTVISDAGASCPVTTTDTVNTWQQTDFYSTLCPVVDVVACNAHAYFNAETAPSQAGTFVQGQLDIVKELCGGKDGYVLETGWPSQCTANGAATCSESDQATAIAALKEVVGGSVVFFSFTDDAWKDDGSCQCEQHWGCGQLF